MACYKSGQALDAYHDEVSNAEDSPDTAVAESTPPAERNAVVAVVDAYDMLVAAAAVAVVADTPVAVIASVVGVVVGVEEMMRPTMIWNRKLRTSAR